MKSDLQKKQAEMRRMKKKRARAHSHILISHAAVIQRTSVLQNNIFYSISLVLFAHTLGIRHRWNRRLHTIYIYLWYMHLVAAAAARCVCMM